MTLCVGIDFGTSGARLVVIDESESICFENAIAFSSVESATQPSVWHRALFELIESIPAGLKPSIHRVGIDGTSSTLLLCDSGGEPLAPPKMYNDRGLPQVLEHLSLIAPPEHIVLSLSSSLCKYLSWEKTPQFSQAGYLLHQADWLAAQLHGNLGLSDYHNCLKLGFAPDTLAYPDWFDKLLDVSKLPQPIEPGLAAGKILTAIAHKLGLPANTEIVAGTTDSIAAFIASGADQIGDAVTSLGSTIALKLLSANRIESSTFGVYSHWFGQLWLVGGASNAGGAVLKHLFSASELEQYSQEIDWSKSVEETYYPLLQKGERFPINNPDLEPSLAPKPDCSVQYLQGILASLTRIEKEGYDKLISLGADTVRRIYTAGGGTRNVPWMTWRQTQFEIPVLISKQTEAAFGTAKLAYRGGVNRSE